MSSARRSAIAWAIAILPFLIGAAPPGVDGYSVLRDNTLEIYYHPEAQAEAEEVRDVVHAAIDELAPRLPLGEEPVSIVIADTFADFARFAPDFTHISVEGVAHSQSGWIVVKSRGLHQATSSFPGTVRHELVHILLARNTRPGNLPRWLNEGIAMMLAGELHWSAPIRVARMQATGDIIDYTDLDFAFMSGDGNLVHNAYAQSLSMTEYLADELGEERFWEMVHSLEHQSFGKAVHEYLGAYPREFWQSWRRTLWAVALVVSLMSGFTAFQIMAVLLVIAYLRKRKHAQARLAQWEEEEAEGEVFTVWDLENQEPPYPWEEDEDERY